MRKLALLIFALSLSLSAKATFNVWQDQGATIPDPGSGAYIHPQNPNVLYEGNCILVAGPQCFKLYFVAGDYAGTDEGANYAESMTGLAGSWTYYSGNPIVSGVTYIKLFKNAGTYYLYTSVPNASPNYTVSVYTSTNGYSFGLAKANSLVKDGNSWDAAGVGQLAVAGKIGSTWYGWVTGTSGSAFTWGLACSSDLISWAFCGSQPAYSYQNSSNLWIEQINGIYYGWTQVANPAYPGATYNLPSDITRWSAPAPNGPWTPLGTETLYRTLASEGVGVAQGQAADPTGPIAALGNLYMFFLGSPNGATVAVTNINVAIAYSMTLSQLVAGYEGVQNVPIPFSNLNLKTLASDTFARSNVNPLAPNWTAALLSSSGWSTAQIVSQAVTPSTTNDRADSFYNGITWPNDQWAQITAQSSSAYSSVGPAVRVVGTTSGTEYIIDWRNTGGGLGGSGTAYLVARYGSNQYTLTSVSLTLNASDTLALAVIGANLWMYYNGGLLGPAISDSNITSGSAGLYVAQQGGGTVSLNDFVGGGFQTPPPIVTPSARAFIF
jgi:hypothetical protein